MRLLWPDHRFSGMPSEIGALLPVADHNALVFDLAESHDPSLEQTVVAPLFLANPFINLQDTARRLERLNVAAIANLPSVCQYEADFQNSLDLMNLGRDREQRALEFFDGAGFDICRTITPECPNPGDGARVKCLLIARSFGDLARPDLRDDRIQILRKRLTSNLGGMGVVILGEEAHSWLGAQNLDLDKR